MIKVEIPINLDDILKLSLIMFVAIANLQTTSLPTAFKISAINIIIKNTLLYIANCKLLEEKLARIVKALNIPIDSVLKMFVINITL